MVGVKRAGGSRVKGVGVVGSRGWGGGVKALGVFGVKGWGSGVKGVIGTRGW